MKTNMNRIAASCALIASVFLAGCVASIAPIATPSPTATPVAPATPVIIVIDRPAAQPAPQDNTASYFLITVALIALAVISGSAVATALHLRSTARQLAKDAAKTEAPTYMLAQPEQARRLTESDAYRILRDRGFTPEEAARAIEDAKARQLAAPK